MARIKYYYDTETCKYERVKVSTWDVVLNLLGFLSVAMIIAIAIVIIYSTYFESPKEAKLAATPPMVGVPALLRWLSGPAERMLLPQPMRLANCTNVPVSSSPSRAPSSSVLMRAASRCYLPSAPLAWR